MQPINSGVNHCFLTIDNLNGVIFIKITGAKAINITIFAFISF